MQSSSLCIFKTMSIPARHDPALRKLSAYPLIRSVGSASCRHHCVDVWPAVAVYSLILRTAYPRRLCVDTLRSRQPGCASRSRATFLQLATVTRVPMLVYTGVSKWSGLPTVLGLGLNCSFRLRRLRPFLRGLDLLFRGPRKRLGFRWVNPRWEGGEMKRSSESV